MEKITTKVKIFSIVSILYLILFNVFGCKNNQTTESPITNQIDLHTDNTSYKNTDSIKIILVNNSSSDISIGYRCSNYLEMYYQKKENNSWSDNIFFWYMSLRCEIDIDTLQQNHELEHYIKAEDIDSIGIFRLVINYYNLKDKINSTLYSNSFEIKQR